MKSQEIKDKYLKLSSKELREELNKTYAEARKDRLEVEAKKSQNTAQLRKTRVNIARILTVINARGSEEK